MTTTPGDLASMTVEHLKANIEFMLHDRRPFDFNMRQARGNLAELARRLTEMERELAEARQQLADAAMEINCAGPVAHRIRVLKRQHADEIETLRYQHEGHP